MRRDRENCTQIHVLVVDDHDIAREIARVILESDEITVSEACDGLTAIRLARENHFDAILVDLLMPGMSGLEVAGELRARDDSVSQIPLIAITAESNTASLADPKAGGFDALLTKPVDPEEMLGTVRHFAETYRASRSTKQCAS